MACTSYQIAMRQCQFVVSNVLKRSSVSHHHVYFLADFDELRKGRVHVKCPPILILKKNVPLIKQNFEKKKKIKNRFQILIFRIPVIKHIF